MTTRPSHDEPSIEASSRVPDGDEKRQEEQGTSTAGDVAIEVLSGGLEAAADGVCWVVASVFSSIGDLG